MRNRAVTFRRIGMRSNVCLLIFNDIVRIYFAIELPSYFVFILNRLSDEHIVSVVKYSNIYSVAFLSI